MAHSDHRPRGKGVGVPLDQVTHDRDALGRRAIGQPYDAAVWSLLRKDQETKVLVDRDQDAVFGEGALQDRCVTRIHLPLAGVRDVMTAFDEPSRESRPGASVDEEAHGSPDLDVIERIVGDDGVGIGEACVNVLGLERRVVLDEVVLRHTLREQAEH